MDISFNGYDEGIVTFEAESDVHVGQPVMVCDSGKVKAAAGAFCGICTGLRNGYAAVQLRGYVKVPYKDTLAVGYKKLSASDGKVSEDTSGGREILVLDIDKSAGCAGIIL